MKTKLTYKERNWLAGFVDGEGYIGFEKTYKKINSIKYRSIHPKIIVANCNKHIIYYIYNLIGRKGSIYSQQQKSHWKISYRIQFTKQTAIQFLKLIYHYLKIKKAQAQLCLDWNKSVRKIVKKNKLGQFKRLNSRIKIKRLFLYKECKRLNKRGISERT